MSDTAVVMAEANAESAPDARAVTGALPGFGGAKLTGGGAAFLLLTVGIFWYQFHVIQTGDAAPKWSHLRWGYLGLILLFLPVETLASAVRTWVVYRTLQPSVRLWTCIKAEWVNVALNTLTPSHLGGGPGQVYMLSREGVTVGRALTASLLSFSGTMFGLLCLGLYSLLVPTAGAIRPLFEATVWTLIAMTAAMAFSAVWPAVFRVALAGISRSLRRWGLARRPLQDWWPPDEARTGPPVDRVGHLSGRLLDLIYTYRADVSRFFRTARYSFVWVCLLGLVFLLARAVLAYLCIRFLGIEASSLRRIVEIQVTLIFLIFFAPTPGGAGLAEGASAVLMAQIVPVGFAPFYNLLWRVSTVYLATLAGIFVLVSALLKDARTLIRHRH